ncbi:MAG: hypothetical protein AAFP98_01465 [Pseudomonadota bacterium]
MKTFRWNFVKEEDGNGPYIIAAAMFFGTVIGGFALDNAQDDFAQLQLQNATDAAALAAAANIDDPAEARAIALKTVETNLGAGSDVIRGSDIQFGYVELGTQEFVAGPDQDGNFGAVSIQAERSMRRDNPIASALVKFVGLPQIESQAQAIAATRRGGLGAFYACEDAVLLMTEGVVRASGRLNLNGAVCVHGADGVWTGGGSIYGPDVRFSADDIDAIAMATYSPSSIPEEQLKVGRYLEPVILPGLDEMEDNLWAELVNECRWHVAREDDNDDDDDDDDDIGKGRKSIEDLLTVDGLYLGNTIPSFVLNRGAADIVCFEDDIRVNASDLKPNTIYASRADITVLGDQSLERVAIVSRGEVQFQGGSGRVYDQMFLLADLVDLGSNATWGPKFGCFEESYRGYVMAQEEVRFGGSTTLHNVVAAAPTINLAGSLTATSLYLETTNELHLKGNTQITSCDFALSSEFDLANGSLSGGSTSGSLLVD